MFFSTIKMQLRDDDLDQNNDHIFFKFFSLLLDQRLLPRLLLGLQKS